MKWWDSNPGLTFRQIFSRSKGMHDLKEVQTWIWDQTQINPRIVNKWCNGGNPSIKNIDLILSELVKEKTITLSTKYDILYATRTFKIEIKKPVNEIIRLVAIIEDFDQNAKRYIARIYNKEKFVIRERFSEYNYALTAVTAPGIRQKIADKLGTYNFSVTLDKEKSIKQL